MANELKYDIKNFTDDLCALRDLKSRLQDVDVSVTESASASGATSVTIKEMADSFGEIKKAMCMLLDQSIGFFSKACAELENADKKGGGEIKKISTAGGDGK